MTVLPPEDQFEDERHACETALEGPFVDLVGKAKSAGWKQADIARALLRLAGAYVIQIDGEHDREDAIAAIRKTVQ